MPTFTFQHIQTTSDQFKNVRESRERKQEGVHSGLGTPLRSVGQEATRGVQERGFGQGFGQGSKPQQTKNSESQQLIADLFSCRFPLLESWIMAGGRVYLSNVLGNLGHIDRIASTCMVELVGDLACLISNARLVFWVLRGKEGYLSMSLRSLEGRLHKACSVARVCPYAAGQRGCIKHALYGEVARKHASSCDTLLGLHVSSLDVLARVPLWLRVRCSGSRM
ncbi:hypothetical protein F2Q70_00015699 [Brassica cretica]|uniref:Uncharacterized protein n=1 Tax=Brassica cretica TaxID=69181 RepID=A0A8S9JCI4_BRACR|nr:hypothetical protein F2Q70_00015699 [Brassica cretica]KAF2579112.1 hypothetical protein F2Q68_00005260 [Brassica cretica]